MYAHEMIDIKDFNELNDLEILKTKCLYGSEFVELPYERQKEIYDYLIMHANFEMCRKNLYQIRYAVTQKFFGWN